jgi:hypothetical protein
MNLVSDSRSGTATVTCVSGAPAAPVPTPTGSPTITPGPNPGGDGTGSVSVFIGSALPAAIILTADPLRIEAGDPRESTIVANVLDLDGNPVANVPVIFQITGSTGSVNERLESESNPRFTDNNGRAVDVLRTNYPLNAPQKQVTVTATTANGITASVVVFIN